LERLLNTDSLPSNAAVSTQFFFWLDKRGGWTKRVRRVRLSGACISRTGENVLAIRARIGSRIFNGIFDRERPDVLQTLGLPETTDHMGFRIDARIPFGKSDLTIEVADTDNLWHNVFSHKVRGPLVPGAADREQWREVELDEAKRRYVSALDVPQRWNPPRGTVHISGWCVDTTGEKIAAVRARVESRSYRAIFGAPRVDLVQNYPRVPSSARAVFGIALRVPRNARRLSLELEQGDGVWTEFCRRKINRTALPSPRKELPRGIDFQAGTRERSRFEFWFDRPANWSKRRRYLHISGWCFAGEGAEVKAIRARIGHEIFPGRYGVVRPDVAARLQGLSGTFGSGFFVDVVVSRGNPKLVLEAKSENGKWEQFYSRKVKGPLFAPRYDDVQEEIGNYSSWIRAYDTVCRSDRRRIRFHIGRLSSRPLISILLPVFNTEAQWLERAIESVRNQRYPHWELCIVDDGSTAAHVWPLVSRFTRSDSRIKAQKLPVSGHISAASNAALELARGQFIALLDHDDELAETALYFAAIELNRDPDLKFIYSDEDKLDPHGRRCDPHFKTDWNPDLFLAQNFVSHLSVISAGLVREVGGFRLGYEGAQDYDLALRCVERISPTQIRHIPRVLYHWRCATESTAFCADSKPYAHDAALRAVAEHLERTGHREASVHPQRRIYRRVIYPLGRAKPLVSLIIPTRDQSGFLRRCLDSIFGITAYRNFEVIIVDNGSREAETAAYLTEIESKGQARVLRVDAPFNYSRLNNLAVSQARGEYLGLLNNDLEATHPEWLSEMLSHASRPEIGAVGACLRYPDGRIQHGGVILGQKGIGAHAHAGLIDEDGYFSRPHLVQDFSAVTAACLLTRKETYVRVGGLDEIHLMVAFNDVDFCLRVQELGLRILWTPFAELRHYESTSRGPEDTLLKQQRFAAEVQYMTDKWGDKLRNDPFYNPNLALDKQLFSLAFPPRLEKPWLTAR
jgi:glycosyltransferase involved in cell wall biosynthesis